MEDTDPAARLAEIREHHARADGSHGGRMFNPERDFLLSEIDRLAEALAAIDALHGNSIDPSECMECDHDRPTKGTEPRAYPCLTKAIANGSALNAAPTDPA